MKKNSKRRMKVRCIVEGKSFASGDVLFSEEPIAFLQGVDPERGVVSDQKSPIFGEPFAGKVLVYPNAVGSSVGAYVIYRLKRNRMAPKAIINQSSDIITASGCAIAGIALYDLPENGISELKNSKQIALNAVRGELILE